MPDPVQSLTRILRDAITKAFGAEVASVDPMIRRSAHADYQANAAMALGKRLGKPPREVAAAIVRHLDAGADAKEICAKVEIAGPGFLNVHLRDEYITRELVDTAGQGSCGLEPASPIETVVIDYSSPNVAKDMHVGHIRSTILGDCLGRVLEAVGHRVVRQNHLGDWGTPFGMLLEHLLDVSEGAPATHHSIADLEAFYKQARAKFDADPAFAERSRRRVVSLQGGDESTLALWRHLVDQSIKAIGVVYAALGVKLTPADVAGESFYNPLLEGIVKELEEKGLARESEGAICVFPAGFKGKEDAPLPLIIRKNDGGYGYATTDLAAIRHRVGTLGATRVIYVVGSPQSQHFAMVFATAKEAGWLVPPARAEHVAFGSILGADKKPFKTRSGETIKLMALVEEAEARARRTVEEKAQDRDPAELAALAKAVGVGAIKYADLSSDRIKDYVFDWDRMLALEGNTAPYLMYAHARIRSIFQKAGIAPGAEPPASAIILGEPSEKALALELLRFGTVVADVAASLEPHRLTGYLFELAGAFTSFYEKCPVLRADTEEQKASRLALCDLTAKVLARGLDLLGIAAPDRM